MLNHSREGSRQHRPYNKSQQNKKAEPVTKTRYISE